MKHKAILRALIGAPLGITINVLIAILISLTVGDGRFYAVVPELTETCGSEIAAVCVQAALSAVCGAAFAGASVLWELEGWSLLKQTAAHFAVSSAATLPVAYAARWMPHTAAGALLYFGIFAAIYAGIWVIQYLRIRKAVRGMNRSLSDQT